MSTYSNEKKKERTVIHLEIEGQHHYYGSLANLFEFYNPKDLGISYGALRNYGLSPEKPYQNAKCIIRKGFLLSKNTNRGKKSTSYGENKV